MGSVDIANFEIVHKGVRWGAHWDAEGKVSYEGFDENGNKISGEPPADVKEAALRHASDNSKKSGKEDGKDKGTEERQPGKHKDLTDFCEQHGISSFSVDSKTGNVLAEDDKGNNVALSDEQKKFLQGKLEEINKENTTTKGKRKFVDELKRGYTLLGKTFKQDIRDLGEVAALPFGLAKDLYKAGKLIAQGKFKELRGRVALRLHDNLLAMGVLSENMENKVKAANKNIEKDLGIKNREARPNILARLSGRVNNNGLPRLAHKEPIKKVVKVVKVVKDNTR